MTDLQDMTQDAAQPVAGTERSTSKNQVSNYGWNNSDCAHSCDYIAPEILLILKRLGIERVLDIGAGNGALCAQLAGSGFDVVGMDNDERGMKLARAAHPAIPFYQLGVQDEPAELMQSHPPFQAVVSTEVIEHLYSPHLIPQFAARVVEDEGYLILSTPYHGYLKNLALSLLNKWDDHHTALWHGGHIKFWSRKTLSELLHRNGFEVVDFSGVGRAPLLWKSMILVARKQVEE